MSVYPTSVRLPSKLRRLLREEARREGRPFVRHIEYILGRWFLDKGVSIDYTPKKPKEEPGEKT